MEGFNEQVVKRVNKLKHTVIKIASVLIWISVPFIFAMIAILTRIQYFMVVGFFVFLIGIYIVWYVFCQQKVDYEYSVSGNDLDISRIINLRKRKIVCRVAINEIEELTKDEKKIENARVTKTFMAARDADANDENYYALFNSPAFGKCVLIFTPNEQILEGMRPHLNKSIVVKLFYSRKTY